MQSCVLFYKSFYQPLPFCILSMSHKLLYHIVELILLATGILFVLIVGYKGYSRYIAAMVEVYDVW